MVETSRLAGVSIIVRGICTGITKVAKCAVMGQECMKPLLPISLDLQRAFCLSILPVLAAARLRHCSAILDISKGLAAPVPGGEAPRMPQSFFDTCANCAV